MKTLTKTSLDAMAKLLPELDEDAQRCIVGGTGDTTGCTQDPPIMYTFEQMDSMVDKGTWMGGYVDGYGYYLPVVTVTGSYRVTGACAEDTKEQSWCMKLLLSANNTPTSFIPNQSIEDYQNLMSGIGQVFSDGMALIFGGEDTDGVDATSGSTVSQVMDITKKIVMSKGGPIGKATNITWGLLDAATEELQNQGKQYIGGLDASMGKGGNYSFWAWHY